MIEVFVSFLQYQVSKKVEMEVDGVEVLAHVLGAADSVLAFKIPA